MFASFLSLKVSCHLFSLGPLHTGHFHTQYCDKKILRLKDNFEPLISSRYIRFFLSLPWFALKPMTLNGQIIAMFIHLFIAILCAKISSVPLK